MADENIALTRAQVILRTDEAYMQAVRARELKQVAESYKQLLLELQKNVESAVRHGLRTRNDLLKVQVKLNEAELNIQRAQNGYRLACMNLGQIIGADDTPAPSQDGDDIAAIGHSAPTQSGVGGRPEHSILQHKADLAAQQVRLTRSDYLPTLALMGGYTYANGGEIAGRKFINNGSAYVGVALKWNLFSFGENTHKLRSARAKQQIAELELQDADEKMDLELNQARNNYEEAQTELQLNERALGQAEENMKMSRAQYDHGLEPLSDLLEAQSLWQQASANLVEARCQLRVAHTRLLKASGQL
jgi:outer membrane protein TolC